MTHLAKCRLVAAILSFFVILVAMVGLLVAAHPCSHPRVVISEKDRDRFARVAILMDGTRSNVRLEDFVTLKDIVQNKIIPSLGLNDVALCLDVRPDFSHEQNTVFGRSDDQPPRVEARILEILRRNRESRQDGQVDGEMYRLMRRLPPIWKRAERIRHAWARQVQKREPPKGDGSNICGPLEEIGRWLSLEDPGGTDPERWLFLLSDLRHEVPGRDCRAVEIPADVRVRWIHSPRSDSPQRPEVETLLRRFFGEREIEKIPLSARTDSALLPSHPTAGLERYQVPTTWKCARPHLDMALLISAGLIVLIWVAAEWIGRRKEPTVAHRSSARAETPGA